MTSKVFTIAGKSLKRIARDRTALFFTVLLPFFIILVIGLAIGEFSERSIPFGIVRSGDGPLARELARTLERSPVLREQNYSSEERLRRDVRRGVVVGGVVIPRDYDAALRNSRTARVAFVSDLRRGFPGALRSTVSAAVARQGARLQAAQFVTARVGRSFDQNLEEAKRVSAIVPSVEVKSETIGRRNRGPFATLPSGFEYTAPANLVLFVFITSLAGSAALIESRRLGITRRMLGTPTTAGTILVGETLGRFAIAIVQAVYIFALGVFVFSVDFGDPLAAIVLLVVFSLVSTAFAMLIGTVFRTPEQAGSIGPPAGIAMGMLAGCMWPRIITPPFMQKLGLVFPQAWAMDAWIKLIGRGAGIVEIAPQLAVLAAFIVVILPLATWRLHRSIVA